MDRSRISDRVARLPETERELFLAKLREKALASGAQWSIPRRLTRDPAPLSFAQQRLWFLDQLEPGKPLYNVFQPLRLNGRLDVGALENALQAIVARHEALRTAIRTAGGIPTQVASENALDRLAVVDLSDSPDSQRDAEMVRVLKTEAGKPFNLSRDLMLRAMLLRLGNQDHVLLLTMHHVAADGWSLGVLFRELSAFYEAFSKDKPATLPELPIQYADYAIWQREWLQGEALESRLSYWKNQLNDLSALQLPTDRPRPVTQSYRGTRQSLVLAKDLSAKLNALSRKEGVTLFMTLLAAFQTLLHRYSGQEDIAVGCPIAGRTRREIEGLIGFFVNTLVMRVDLSGNPTFKELLARVRETALGAYAHQDVPFEKLVEELQPERDLSRSPLFQVMFGLQNTPSSPPQFSGLTVSQMKLDWETAKFDLSLSMHDEASGLRASLEYSTDLFDAATITRMLGHFETELQSIVSNPDRRLADLPILTDAEKHQLLIEWNDTDRDFPIDECVLTLFEQRVERAPHAVAAVCASQQLTYSQLNQRVNQLARYLRKLHVRPEVLVGICIERCLDMIVAILAILKTGGAYVPLDAAYPKERLAFMLKDARVSLLLTQEHMVESLPEHSAQVVCLDRDWSEIARESDEHLENITTLEDLAYVIYTSGSTGNPKGVMISHRSLASHCLCIRDYYQLNESDRVLQFASVNFDASIEQILPTLMSGATLALRDTEVWTPAALLEKIHDSQLTVVNLPAVYWHQLAKAAVDKPGIAGNLRLAVVGGEEMSGEALRLWQQTAFQEVRLLNAYGPTEATITATAYQIPSHYSKNRRPRTTPIGRPLGDRQAFVLDKYGNVVPIGIPGELHIGGDSLARGYLNRSDLTAEKFVPNPFSKKPGARLYKTGDLARYLPDGNLEFLGRTDHQVKIRGFRIELGEIESALNQHTAVRENVVLVREDVPGDKRLAAYVVPQPGVSLTAYNLRSFLREKLPDYMVPSAFVSLDSLPLTPNGKLNRSALPAPDQSRAALETSYVAPRTPVEKSVAAIWTKVLGLDRVGIHDNFFDLGGHSLLATQIVSRIHDAFHRDLPLRAVFENPTVADLAAQIVHLHSSKAPAEEMADILADLESLTDEEAEDLVSLENRKERV